MTQNKLDLAIFTPTLEAGVGRVLFNVAKGLSNKGYNVEIVTIKKSDFDIPESEIKIVNLFAGRTLTSLFKLGKYLRQNKPQVLLTAIYHANLVAGLAHFLSGSDSKLFFSEHIALKQSLKRELFPLRILFNLLVRFFYRYANLVIAVSKEAAEDLAQLGIPASKIRTIYNPVITDSIYTQAAVTVEHPWFDKNHTLVLGAGRLTEQKDFPTLIKAFALMVKSKPAKLMIIGEGPERKNLQQLIIEQSLEDSVVLLGHVKNPYPYFKKSNIFVLSSKYEGLPTVLIEAMALGLQVVSTDCPSGPKEILGSDRGWLVPVGDASALSEAMKDAIANPKPVAVKKDLERFTLEYAVNEYEKSLFNL